MNNPIELPAEVVSEYYDNDCVRVIISPPAGVPPPDWADWARESFPLPVVRVERLAEGGRLLLAVTLGEADEGEVKTPKTFRLPPPASNSNGLQVVVNITENGKPYTPPPPPPPAPRDICERPVRVKSSTHQKIRALSKALNLSIADTIDKAVSAMLA